MLSSERVLYEDNHCLGVIKRAGELSQGDRTGDASLLDLGKAYIKEKYAKPGDVFLGVVHRLDRPVSGAMLFARTSKAAARLSEQFRKRSVEKLYRAVVEGVLPDDSGTLIHYLTGDKKRLKVTAHATDRSGAKRAKLRYTVLDVEGNRSLVEVKLITGAKHQIRAQLSAVGCPIVGDMKYDKRQSPAVCVPLMDGRAIALHAWRLTVTHPTKKDPLTLHAPLPEYWPWPQE